MDFGELGGNLPFILMVVGLILMQFFLRKRRKPALTHQDIVQELLSEISLDQALVESYHRRQKPKKFETVSWRMNKNKLDFLGHSLQVALSDTFTIIDDYNHQIDAARKYRSANYAVNVDVGKIKGPLDKSQQGLEEWLLENAGTKEPPTQSPGVVDSFFSGR